MGGLTKLSLELPAVALVAELAVQFLKIERLKERFRGTKASYTEHEEALEYVLAVLKEATGVE